MTTMVHTIYQPVEKVSAWVILTKDGVYRNWNDFPLSAL